MNPTCPSKQEWFTLIDGEATENRASELRAHANTCPRCAQELELQRQLARDLAAPVPVSSDAVAAVMRRLETAERPERRFTWRLFALGTGALAAAAVIAFLVLPATKEDQGMFSARGQRIAWAQKVGIEIWAVESSPRKLGAAATISPNTPLVASYHNIDRAAAYLLVFAVDARGEIHWAYPGFEDARTDPSAVRLEPLAMQKVLPDSVVLDGLPVGPAELISLIAHEPLHVSRIESLPATERNATSLRARFPTARIDSLSLRVVPAAANKENP